MTEITAEDSAAGLPAGWTETTLGNAFVWGSGGTPKSGTPHYYGGDIPWAIIGDLNDGVIRSTTNTITPEGLNNSSAKWVNAGSVLVAMYGLIGKLGITETPLTTNQAIAFTNPAPIITKYLFYFLWSQRQALNALGAGATQQNISQTVLKAHPFPLAPLSEQHRIVARIEELLSQVDAGVAGLRDLQKKLKRYRAAVLKAACEGTLVPTEADLARAEGRAYEPAGELLARVLAERRARWEADQLAKMRARGAEPTTDRWKAKYEEPAAPDTSDLPELPEGWTWTSLGQAFGVFVGATPSRKVPEYWGGDVRWVSSGEVAFCRITDTREKITEEGLANTSTEVHPAGTVLMGMIGEGRTRGQVAVLGVPACNNQNCAAIRVSETDIPPEYVYRFLEGQYEETRRRGSGNNQPALNKTSVSAMAMPLPPLAEIERIVAEVERRLSVLDQMEAALRDNLKRADRLRQAVLRDAFAGKLVPQDPDDEPAAALLERIRAERAEAGAARAPRDGNGKAPHSAGRGNGGGRKAKGAPQEALPLLAEAALAEVGGERERVRPKA